MGLIDPLLEPVHMLLVEAAVALRRAPNRRDVDAAGRLLDTCTRSIAHLGETGRVARWELAGCAAAVDALAERLEGRRAELAG